MTSPIALPRNLVVCCDGTGNVFDVSPRASNVVKLASVLINNDQQMVYYDPGVGTPDGLGDKIDQGFSARLQKLVGLGLGDGVNRNIVQAYQFLVDHYQGPQDRIWLFGFSRGAFTARAVSGLIELFGILRPNMHNLMGTVLRLYYMRDLADRKAAIEKFRRMFALPPRTSTPLIHFIGVWDTVESVGLGGVLGKSITSSPSLKPSVAHARHAVALDELRNAYTPRLYTPSYLHGAQTLKQVWFAGAHADVGGGYGHDGPGIKSLLSNTPLNWMLGEAHTLGLQLQAPLIDVQNFFPEDPVLSPLHNEARENPWWYLTGVGPRNGSIERFGLADNEPLLIHRSVYERMQNRADYRPFLLNRVAYRLEQAGRIVFLPTNWGQEDVVSVPLY